MKTYCLENSVNNRCWFKSEVPTLDQRTKIDKEVKIKKAISKKRKVAIEWNNIIRIKDVEESSSSSSMSMYSLDSDIEDSKVPSS